MMVTKAGAGRLGADGAIGGGDAGGGGAGGWRGADGGRGESAGMATVLGRAFGAIHRPSGRARTDRTRKPPHTP